jgi:hypothetical protein
MTKYLKAALRKPSVPSPELRRIWSQSVRVYDEARRLAPAVGQCSAEHAAEVVLKMRDLGYRVTVRNYLDWLDGGATYNTFDRAAAAVLGVTVRELNTFDPAPSWFDKRAVGMTPVNRLLRALRVKGGAL